MLDFGCGCGRQARQLLCQSTPPQEYLGLDKDAELIEWCQANLASFHQGFSFRHHAVGTPRTGASPSPDQPRVRRFPAAGDHYTLVNAHSVFTHLLADQTLFYLEECARVMTARALFCSTWFLFDARWFAAANPSTISLHVSGDDPTAAVYYDWTWLRQTLRRVGLRIVRVGWTKVPGFQNTIWMARGEQFPDLADGLTPPDTVLGFGSSSVDLVPPR
ncbi:MAG: class I SAM-dependent methyltransferase [Vicinamibacteraceae bacterium]|nr:class I SAM-dependent methyltransferase [Vicinamibacteraceae bacterium]